MGGMTIINMPVILYLGKYAFRALKDFETKKKNSEDIVFHVKDIGLPYEVDCWE